MRVKVEAPWWMSAHGRSPMWERAWCDPGGTWLFGDGPYLHLPYGTDEPDWEAVKRVFPPAKIARCKTWELVKEGDEWYWLTGKDAAQVAGVVGGGG